MLSSSHRYEDMECDDHSFSKTVMWVMWFNQNIVQPLPIQGTCSAGAPPPSPLTVTVSRPGSVTAGSNVTFHVTVQNTGTGIQHAVALDDPLPANAGLVQVTPSTGSCSSGSDVVCSLGDIGPGATATVDLTFASYGTGKRLQHAIGDGHRDDPAGVGNGVGGGHCRARRQLRERHR